jgi:hypothetical protein
MTALLTESAHDLMARLSEEMKRQAGEKLTRQVLRAIVWNADALAGFMLSAWTWVRETLEDEGLEGRELAEYCRVLLDGIDASLDGYEHVQAMARKSALTSEAAGLRDLEAKLPALRAARPKVAEAFDLATRPPRPIDEALLSESRAALERGQLVTLDDEYLARLRAGQDL